MIMAADFLEMRYPSFLSAGLDTRQNAYQHFQSNGFGCTPAGRVPTFSTLAYNMPDFRRTRANILDSS